MLVKRALATLRRLLAGHARRLPVTVLACVFTVLLLAAVLDCPDLLLRTTLHYWTDREGTRASSAVAHVGTNSDGTLRAPIPAFILRTFKSADRLDIENAAANGSDSARERMIWFKTWEGHNPNHVQIIFNDEDADRFIKGTFDPYVVKAFYKLPRIVQRADMTRYLMLYEFGGVYTDMDTECFTPIDQWTYGHQMVRAIVGVEMPGTTNEGLDQIVQWTMAMAPRHEFLDDVIRALSHRVHTHTREFLTHVDNVVPITGPGLWTDVFYDYLRKKEFDPHAVIGMHRAYKLIGDFMLLGRVHFQVPFIFSMHRFSGEFKDGWKKKQEKLLLSPADISTDATHDSPPASIKLNRTIPHRILRPMRTSSRRQLKTMLTPSQWQWFNSWEHENPTHLQLLFGERDLDRFVKGAFSKKIGAAYFKLKRELRPLFGRYLMLYIFGGVSTRDSVECLRSFSEWDGVDDRTSLVLSVEMNGKLGDSVVAASPKNPFIRDLIAIITERIRTTSEEWLDKDAFVAAAIGDLAVIEIGKQYKFNASAAQTSTVGYTKNNDILLLSSKYAVGEDAIFKIHEV
ncbi:membrane-bound alpha-1,6- mannosyltransferase Initiation-specific [Chytriomyces hyalinus]|nr:membrane-bound alpha-1,6- mannosyltransferase Initiation-specific [Chytriomyces hyalinus]